MMMRPSRRVATVLVAALLFAPLLWGGGLGTSLPPIPGAVSRTAAFGGAATSNGKSAIPPSAPSTVAHDPATPTRLYWRVQAVKLQPGVRTLVILGADALEPGAVLVDVTLPPGPHARTMYLAYLAFAPTPN